MKIGILLFFSCLIAQAQSFKEQYESFKKQAIRQYSDFRNQANDDYARFLRAAWQYYKEMPVVEQPQEVPVPPIVYEDDGENEATPLPYDTIVLNTEPQPQPQPISPIEEKEGNDRLVSFSFYGTNLMVRFPKDSKFSLSNLSADTFAAQWEILSDEAYDNLIKDCLDIRQRLSLCDWAYVELLQMAAEAVCGKTNDAVFLQAYIYVQTGYQMRLAMSQTNKLYMLVGSECRIYNRTYYVIDGTNFYPLNCEEKKLYISGAKFQDEKGLSLLINSEQGFNEDKKYRSLQSVSGVHAQVCVNKNQMDFYNKYPTAMLNDDFSSRWMFYANAPMSKTVKESLYPYLRNALKGRGELESVSLLLNFVQTAFQYEYDDKVWGHDRAFFAEESLYYPYCDCEDRSILFSRLVRDLLGLNVVLLYYPGHLAAAVHFNSEVKGDYLIISDRKYIVCDPTYIGAPVGETMPEMDNHTAKVIMLGR